jgi:L-ascorbate metabolism protein UlaG (beta-lactamase superfamily)
MSLSVRWLGHASFQIKANGKNIYIDPYEGEYAEKANIILVTHSHHDHCDVSKINNACREDTDIIAPADCAQKIGEEVKALRPGEKTVMRGITVEAVQAYNYKRFRTPGIPFHPKGLGVGYLITTEDKAIYHAGDTDFIPEMKQLKDVYLALLPIGDTYTMDITEAVEAALVINPKVVIPMHTLDVDPMKFKRALEAKSQIEAVVLKPGQQLALQ